MSEIEQRIKRKIETVGTPLKDWDINIYRGILTGYNEAFIINGEKRKQLIDEDAKSAEIIRPILRGRDIKKYANDCPDLWLINTHNGLKEKGIKPINVDDYPAVKKHLDEHYQQLSIRADKGDTAYNLRNCAYMEDFFRPKIAWGNLNIQAAYTIVPEGVFLNAPCPIIVPANKYLLAVLNSKLADYFIRSLGVARNGGYFEYKPMFVEQLPVPTISEEIQIEIEELIEQKLLLKDRELDNKIENIIFTIYGLSKEEIKFIESQ